MCVASPPPLIPFSYISIKSQGNPVPNRQGGSMLPAPPISRAKREPSVPGCYLGGQDQAGGDGSDAFSTRSQPTRTSQIQASSIPTSHGTWHQSQMDAQCLGAEKPDSTDPSFTFTQAMAPVPLALQTPMSYWNANRSMAWCQYSAIGSSQPRLPNHRQHSVQPRQGLWCRDVSEQKPRGMENPQLCTAGKLSCSPHREPFHISHLPSS